MWVGAMMFWWMGRKHREPGTRGHTVWVEGYESICAGLISGSALVGKDRDDVIECDDEPP